MMKRGEKKQWLDTVAASFVGDECLRFPFPLDPRGYGNFQDRQRKTTMAHIYICELANGVRPPFHEAAHSCGNSWCVNRIHLRWATSAENEADKIQHGTHNRGERQGASKLRAADVTEIRRQLSQGVKQRDIAANFSVTEALICNIKMGRSWAWL
jgi:hypothetical protein